MDKSNPYWWQEDNLGHRRRSKDKDWLLYAVTGAGKTTAGLKMLKDDLETGTCKKIIIIAPTRPVCHQWVEDAWDKFKISLTLDWKPKNELVKDFQGAVITYAMMWQHCQALRAFITKNPTSVLHDEIHHLGEDMQHGEAAKISCEPAVKRIGMSASPFKNTWVQIPFVKYDARGMFIADYRLEYPQGLTLGIVRKLHFLTYDGPLDYTMAGGRPGEEDRHIIADFQKELRSDEDRARLHAALDPTGGFMEKMVHDMHKMNMQLRERDKYPWGNLMVCKDSEHAKKMAQLIRKVTNHEPLTVLSDATKFQDANCDEQEEVHKALLAFKNSDRVWLNAVGLCSEGSNIPRLRCLGYATNKLTPTAFIQYVGRIIRKMSGQNDRDAYAFLYNHDTLWKYAVKYMRQIEYADDLLREKEENGGDEGDAGGDGDGTGDGGDRNTRTFVLNSSNGELTDWLDGTHCRSGEQLNEALSVMKQLGFTQSDPSEISILIELYKRNGVPFPGASFPAAPTPTTVAEPTAEARTDLRLKYGRARYDALTKSYVKNAIFKPLGSIGAAPDNPSDLSKMYWEAHQDCARKTGTPPVGDETCTIEDFDVKIAYREKQIKEACSKKTASNLINGAKEKAQEVTYGGS
jgi:superfamily II DNA or RNA helicase